MEFEELKIEVPVGKNSDDEEELPPVAERRYENKAAGNFVTGFDVNSEESKERRQRRAKRFGFKFESEKKTIETENDKDYAEKNPARIPFELPKIPEAEVRLDALFLHGVDEMSTRDVFSYLADFAPGSVEWIDDSSCNVVWDDDHTAARVISAISQPLPLPQTNVEVEEMSTDIKPKPQWRLASKSHSKAQQLLMRQATKRDKKQLGAARRSMYYLVHGNPNREGQRGHKGKKRGLVSSSRKRKIALEKEKARQKSSGEPEVDFVEEMEVEESDGPQLPPLKVMVTNDVREEEKNALRMRMYADDEGEEEGEEEKKEEKKAGKEKERREKRREHERRDGPRGQPIDLRKKLQGRRHGFSVNNMPTLSIEIREEPAS